MKQKIRLEGIYDDAILNFMKEKSISGYTFDFRPKSFNFIQKYRFEDIITKHHLPLNHYYLHFCNEKDYVIKRIIEDLENLLGRPLNEQNNIFLEFSDNQTAAWYEHFALPFYWHYNSCKNIEHILNARNLQGIVLNFKFLDNYCAHEYLDQFAVLFYRQMQKSYLKDGLQLIFSIDWDSNIPPGIQEYFDFDLISLPINSKIETSYRKINYDLLSQELRIARF